MGDTTTGRPLSVLSFTILKMRFINNFNKDSEWSTGRVYKGDDWLGKYQGQNFTRSTLWQRLKIRLRLSKKRLP